MRDYVGIDLGTTNCAICSFNGEDVTLYKSPDQQDVTPSAIYVDRRGNKLVGLRAYNNAARNPESSATLFKRLMGTSTTMKMPDAGITTTPEECSAEMLRTLWGYLPDRVRDDSGTGTVITVPAAFNQMQKDATMAAAHAAAMGAFALMQEPVAAVMSVMRKRRSDGLFVIFDIGAGTLDIAVAQSISGHVSLLAHGGIAMCGGRDFDRLIANNIIRPWLAQQFQLPPDFASNPNYKSLLRMATLAGERAKIRLSSGSDTTISDPDFDGMGFRDEAGAEIYLDVPLSCATFDGLIGAEVAKAVGAARDAIEKAGLSPHDIDRVVFVGGPTQYKPLRERVAFELGIAPSTEVNPMTAVAEGAAVFAESVDWSSQVRGRKSTRGAMSAGARLPISFTFPSRTPDTKARIAIRLTGAVPAGCEYQIDSLDTGWTSGRGGLADGASLEVSLPRAGENSFKVFVFDPSGGNVALENSIIKIARTAATIDAIPSSSTISIEALDRLGGRPVPVALVEQGGQLPAKGRLVFAATESLRAGGLGEIKFKLWEGQIKDPITDNRFIGALTIVGGDFDDGIISAGDELICEYVVSDSGNIHMAVTVPSIRGTFRKGNFYSAELGKVDLGEAGKLIAEDAEAVLTRAMEVAGKIKSMHLDEAIKKLHAAAATPLEQSDPETAKKSMDEVLEAKSLIAKVRGEHGQEMRQLDLDKCVHVFNNFVREHATVAESGMFDSLARTAQRSIDEKRSDFESQLDELRGKGFVVLWRQDWFVVGRFKELSVASHLFPNRALFRKLIAAGESAIEADRIDELRHVVAELDMAKIGVGVDDNMLAVTNIVLKSHAS
jgi:molecular chaperone DnaK